MNAEVIHTLEKLRAWYEEQGDEERERAYSRAIESVEEHPRPLQSGKDAMRLKWIGKGIGWRIDQVLGTNTVDKDDGSATPKSQSEAKPKKKRGRKKKSTPPQQEEDNDEPSRPSIRVNFVEEGSSSVPRRSRPAPAQGVSRDTVEKLVGVVKNLCQRFGGPDIHVALGGAYRRDQPFVDTLPFLLTDRRQPNTVERVRQVLAKLAQRLTDARLLQGFELPSPGIAGKGRAVFRSGHRIPLALICVPAFEWPYALLRYTGPIEYWRALQQHASRQSPQLTEKGLYQGRTPVAGCRTERDIFNQLCAQWRPPNTR
jgi:DNA polymerase/3'-5' exonuclease PolX